VEQGGEERVDDVVVVAERRRTTLNVELFDPREEHHPVQAQTDAEARPQQLPLQEEQPRHEEERRRIRARTSHLVARKYHSRLERTTAPFGTEVQAVADGAKAAALLHRASFAAMPTAPPG
jgi:hypothetical protein